MKTGRIGLVTGVAALGGLLATVSVQAWYNAARTTYLTFQTPVALPGVGLQPGTYIFALAAPGERVDIVRVSSRDRRRVYYAGFTQLVHRSAGAPVNQAISFGESRLDAPRPILVWYPPNESTGRRFIYPTATRQLLAPSH